MNITLVCVWPNHMDYPLWRKQIMKYRKYFTQILVSLSNNNEPPNITDYIKQSLGEIGIPVFDAPELKGEDDWRDRSIKKLWGNINNEWIWFTEQDFFVKDEKFFRMIDRFVTLHKLDYVVFNDNGRLHPACFFVKKILADKVEKDFSPIQDKEDHFAKFAKGIVDKGKGMFLEDMDLHHGKDFYHMKGLTHNFQRFRMGIEPTALNDFITYNHYAIEVDPQNALFLAIEQAIEDNYGEGTSEVAEFFKPLITI